MGFEIVEERLQFGRPRTGWRGASRFHQRLSALRHGRQHIGNKPPQRARERWRNRVADLTCNFDLAAAESEIVGKAHQPRRLAVCNGPVLVGMKISSLFGLVEL